MESTEIIEQLEEATDRFPRSAVTAAVARRMRSHQSFCAFCKPVFERAEIEAAADQS
jgi:hypothetical protein